MTRTRSITFLASATALLLTASAADSVVIEHRHDHPENHRRGHGAAGALGEPCGN
jgi:hypothetical protein